MDLLTRIEASLEFMNDGGPIGDRVDFVNLREVLEGSREALLKLDEYEHREKLHMDRCRHDMERIVRLEQQNEARETELADLEQEAARLRSELDRYRNALALLRPGIELDLRYDAASAPVLCADCPPPDYPTDETRCAPCPRRSVVETPVTNEETQ